MEDDELDREKCFNLSVQISDMVEAAVQDDGIEPHAAFDAILCALITCLLKGENRTATAQYVVNVMKFLRPNLLR
jgi:hypothetical protein